MKTLDFFFIKDVGDTVSLIENFLTDGSPVYDIEIGENLKIFPVNKQEALNRFELLRQALIA